jgi:putative acetyltransferase
MMTVVRIEQRPLGDGQLAVLLAAAVEELRRRYPDYVGEHPLDPRTEFLVALTDGVPAGCVGVHRMDETRAEMKRLYVVPGYRGTGVARGLVVELERRVVAMGCRELLLETGSRQPEAIALYRSMGYRPIAPYDGDYRPSPISRCFAKLMVYENG